MKNIILIFLFLTASLGLNAQIVREAESDIGSLDIGSTTPTEQDEAANLNISSSNFSSSNGKFKKNNDISIDVEIKNNSSVIATGLRVEISLPSMVLVNGSSSHISETLASNATKNIKFTFFVRNEYQGVKIPVKIKYSCDKSTAKSKTFVLNLDESVVKNHAFILTTSTYANSSVWAYLPNAQKSGSKLDSLCKNDYQFNDIYYKNNLSTDDFTSALKKMKEVDENDQLLIYIAGHGYFDKVFSQGYLVFNNTNARETSTMFSHAQLAQILDKMPCKHILVIIDACYSSTFDFKVVDAMLAGDLRSRGTKSIDKYIKDELKLKTRLYLTSGETQTGTGTRNSEYSPFSSAIINALQNSTYKNDGVVNYYELRYGLDQQKIKPTPRGADFGSNETNANFLFIVK